jgi:hypothetical protein
MITLESEYKQWLLVLSQTTPKSGNGKYTAEEYQRDAVKLRMHSQNHVTNTHKYSIKH